MAYDFEIKFLINCEQLKMFSKISNTSLLLQYFQCPISIYQSFLFTQFMNQSFFYELSLLHIFRSFSSHYF